MTSIGIAYIVINLNPFWTSLLARCIFKESIFKAEYLAMIICFLGVIGLSLGGSNEHALNNMHTFGYFIAGIIILFAASWT